MLRIDPEYYRMGQVLLIAQKMGKNLFFLYPDIVQTRRDNKA